MLCFWKTVSPYGCKTGTWSQHTVSKTWSSSSTCILNVHTVTDFSRRWRSADGMNDTPQALPEFHVKTPPSGYITITCAAAVPSMTMNTGASQLYSWLPLCSDAVPAVPCPLCVRSRFKHDDTQLYHLKRHQAIPLKTDYIVCRSLTCCRPPPHVQLIMHQWIVDTNTLQTKLAQHLNVHC